MLKRVPDRLLKPAEVEAGLRWYSDESHDLYVWSDKAGMISRFQFTYNKGTGREEVIEWRGGEMVGHALIDPGEDLSIHKKTPIIVANGVWDEAAVSREFERAAHGIEQSVYKYILRRLGRSVPPPNRAAATTQAGSARSHAMRARSLEDREKDLRVQGKIRRRK